MFSPTTFFKKDIYVKIFLLSLGRYVFHNDAQTETTAKLTSKLAQTWRKMLNIFNKF